MKTIPNELSKKFNTLKGRKELIKRYGDSNTFFTGQNADGEQVTISFSSKRGIMLTTYQNNGWIRINYYNTEGIAEGETFEGKWNK